MAFPRQNRRQRGLAAHAVSLFLVVGLAAAESNPAVATALKQLNCPNCGTGLSQYTPGAQTLVCPNCSSYVAVGSDDPNVIGESGRLKQPPVPIELGTTFKHQDVAYMILGRVAYVGWDSEESWEWNEWLLGADDGRMLWLAYDEKGFSIYTKERFRQPFDMDNDRVLELKGDKIWIRERYPARILGAEGEITWRAKENERLKVAEGAKHGKRYSIQATNDEIELYTGEAIPLIAVAQSTDNQEWFNKLQRRVEFGGIMRMVAGICLGFSVLAFCMTTTLGGAWLVLYMMVVGGGGIALYATAPQPQ